MTEQIKEGGNNPIIKKTRVSKKLVESNEEKIIKPVKLPKEPITLLVKDDAASNPHFVEETDVHEITFKSLPIPDWLLSTLSTMGYKKPTTIQEKAIPLAIEGRDILASSQTGSGKTVAFGVPVIVKLEESQQSACLILAPTRELAAQIKTVIHALRGDKKIFTALLVGGESITAQFKQLKADPRIIIATPGRLMDHMKRGTVKLNRFDTLVLDEFDRMLEMGFKEAIEQIFHKLAEVKQTLMFSATTRDSVMKLAQKYLKSPVEIKVGVPKSQPLNIKQEFLYTTHAKKYSDLLVELEKRHGSIIIFVGTKHGVDNLAEKLEEDGKSVDVIHGDLRQRQRENVIKSFRNEKFEILVATDVVARGIDIPHIMHVINYDMPQCLEDYNHRIGRTGRVVGSQGESLCLVCLPSDKKKYNNIKMGLNSDEMEPETYGRKSGGGGNSRFGRGNSGGRSEGNRSNFRTRDSDSGGDRSRFNSNSSYGGNSNNNGNSGGSTGGGKRFGAGKFDNNSSFGGNTDGGNGGGKRFGSNSSSDGNANSNNNASSGGSTGGGKRFGSGKFDNNSSSGGNENSSNNGNSGGSNSGNAYGGNGGGKRFGSNSSSGGNGGGGNGGGKRFGSNSSSGGASSGGSRFFSKKPRD